MQTIVKDFVTIEMLFHAKALEIYSGIFQQLDSLQEIDDLEVGYVVAFSVNPVVE
jgi:hypothetical protein